MSNIQNIDVSLQEIVKNTSKDLYLIPKFQRDFVWTTKDITDLGDSIIRGYPISSLLLMPENGTLKVGSHSLIKDSSLIDTQEINSEETGTKLYILDGQQRMTSIAKLFLASDLKNEYYFDLLAILVEKYPEDNISNISGIDFNNKTNSKIDESFCKKFQRGEEEKNTKQKNRFISGKTILESRFGSVINKFLSNFTASEENIDKYTDYLSGILGSISSYSIPATVIASDSELGIVIRVFEKVNSTGKKLTLFDLINAKSFQIEDRIHGGLASFLNNKLNSACRNNPEFKNGIYKFFKYSDEGESYDKLDRIIRIFEISYLLSTHVTPSITQATMLKRNPEFWFEQWDKNKETLLRAIQWINEEHLIEATQVAFLEYMLAIFLVTPKALNYPNYTKELKRYALFLTLNGSGFSKSNLDIVEKFFDFAKHVCNSHEFDKHDYPVLTGSPYLTGSKVLEISQSKAEFKAVLNILYQEKPTNKFHRDILDNKIVMSKLNNFDYHHIYPKAKVKNFSARSPFNSIANIILIDIKTNREDIKDKSPKDYFSKIARKVQFSLESTCEQNLIDFTHAKEVETEEEALNFISERAELIANEINHYFP